MYKMLFFIVSNVIYWGIIYSFYWYTFKYKKYKRIEARLFPE